MTQADKLLAAMRANRRGWAMADLERLCRSKGLDVAAPKRGSHFKVAHADLPQILIVPYNRPIKPVYVTALIEMIDRLEAKQ